MTGSGKTGLLTVAAEEAMTAGVPLLAIDVKGDLKLPPTSAAPHLPRSASPRPT